jgi:hypothetical protein
VECDEDNKAVGNGGKAVGWAQSASKVAGIGGLDIIDPFLARTSTGKKVRR